MSERKPIVFTFLGVPGSGKSYFARRLAQETGMLRLSSDAMRLAIFGSRDAIAKVYHSDDRENVNAYVDRAIVYVMGEILARGEDVIYDAHYNRSSGRDWLTQRLSEHDAKVVLIRIITPYNIALQRGQDREETNDQRRLSESEMREVMDRHNANTDEPGADELVIDIDGTVTFEEQYKSFRTQLEDFDE